MTALGDLLGRLDTDPVRRGRQFERICEWYLTHDPEYAGELRQVWLWKDWPGRWGADAGIDLVAEDVRGRLWAIQAKAYDSGTWITKRDVDTFLAEAGRPEFSFRLLIATTNWIGRTAKRTIEAQEKPASVLLLGDLEAACVNWPASPSVLRARRQPPKRPRPHQRKAINAVVKGFEEAERGQLVMACGTGKTLTALFITEKLAVSRILVLVPSLSLLKQTLREWTANAKVRFDFLPVCSDETVALDPDAVVSNTSDLGFPVTTDPGEIAAFLRRRSSVARVVFATYQSSPEIAKAFRSGWVPAFDLAVADEAHRCAGRASSDFSTILNAEAIKARRRLFMTATPRDYTRRVLRETKEADFEFASMDDEEKFGPVFHRLGFAEAIQRDLLTDYRVVVVGVDDATYRDWAQRGRFVTLDGTKVTDARTLAGKIGLAKAMRRYDLHRTITFHSRVERAKEFAHSLPEVIAWMPPRQRPTGHVWADFASGEMPAGERHALLQRLGSIDDGERGLIANARCLAEGVDVPTLDGVAFIDPRRSEVDIVQAIGRAIRLAPDKTVGTIVLPVFIDTDVDAEIALDGSAFKPVWDVIKALRSHDDEIGEQLDELRRQQGRQRQRPRLPGKIHLDLPARVSLDFARAFDVRLVEQTTASFNYNLGLLQAFAAREGHARVPLGHVEGRIRLGYWVANQRASKDKLSPERRSQLEAVPGWTWDVLGEKWAESYAAAHTFAQREGHARIPVNHIEGGIKLGQWVVIQRSNKDQLSQPRREELEALPGWTWDPYADAWDERLAATRAFAEREGHARIPRSHVENGISLGSWVLIQRRNRDTLSPKRRAQLEAIPGWTWDPFADAWNQSFSALKKFAAREGHARVPSGHIEDGVRLGRWVTLKRSNKDRLSEERRARLESLPGWGWDARADTWAQKLTALQRFVEREGHARVPERHIEDGIKLGSWVREQRGNKDKIGQQRREQLEAIPGWTWDPYADAWNRNYMALKQFADREGHARVPRKCIENSVKLGSWVGDQRINQHKLGKERCARLEALPGWSWDPVADAFAENIAALGAFVEREGHARVSYSHIEDGIKLGQWVRTQRATREKLNPELRARLEALPGWELGPPR